MVHEKRMGTEHKGLKAGAARRRWLGRSLALLLGALVCLAAACSWRLHTRAPAKSELSVAPDFALPDYRGGVVTLDGLLAKGPAVVIFYRGYW